MIGITTMLCLVVSRSLSRAERLNADLALFNDRLPKLVA